MIITETTKRECCALRDFLILGDIDKSRNNGKFIITNKGYSSYVFCKYCGQRWDYYRQPGDMDSNYHRLPLPWEKQ